MISAATNTPPTNTIIYLPIFHSHLIFIYQTKIQSNRFKNTTSTTSATNTTTTTTTTTATTTTTTATLYFFNILCGALFISPAPITTDLSSHHQLQYDQNQIFICRSEPSKLTLSERRRIFSPLPSSTPFKNTTKPNRQSFGFKTVGTLLAIFQNKSLPSKTVSSVAATPPPPSAAITTNTSGINSNNNKDKSIAIKRVDRIRAMYEKEPSIDLDLNYDSGKENYDSGGEDNLLWPSTNRAFSFNLTADTTNTATTATTANLSSYFQMNTSKISFNDVSQKNNDDSTKSRRSKSFVFNQSSSHQTDGGVATQLNTSKNNVRNERLSRPNLWRSFSADDSTTSNRVADVSRKSDKKKSCNPEWLKYFGQSKVEVKPTSSENRSNKNTPPSTAIIEGLYSRLDDLESKLMPFPSSTESLVVLSAQLTRNNKRNSKGSPNDQRRPRQQLSPMILSGTDLRTADVDFERIYSDLMATINHSDLAAGNSNNNNLDEEFEKMCAELTEDELRNADADFERLFLAVNTRFF